MLSPAFPHRSTSDLRSSCLWFEKLRTRSKARAHFGAELSLEEMLDDPIVQDLMRSDRVSRHDVEAAISYAAASNRRVC